MMSRTALDLWVGIFVAIGFAALAFLAVKVGNFSGLNTSETYRIEAAFDNIGGLKARAPVKSAGVLIGRVQAIRFDSDSYRAFDHPFGGLIGNFDRDSDNFMHTPL